MVPPSYEHLCVHYIADGLRQGLTRFSAQPTRAALVYAVSPDDPLRVHDPQNLLRGHEPKLADFFQGSDHWRHEKSDRRHASIFEDCRCESPPLAGLICCGGRAASVFYLMWFTEHHPDMCATGPTERWLEHAAGVLAQDLAAGEALRSDSASYVLREYATSAVRDHIVDRRSQMLGLDTRLRVYPILDAILGVSKTMEEGSWPMGRLVFVEPGEIGDLDLLLRFPPLERPSLENHKHVRKLLTCVERSERRLVSDGQHVVGVAADRLPESRITADFRRGYGFVRIGSEPVCSFADGAFHSTTRKAKLVQLEEALLEARLGEHEGAQLPPERGTELFQLVARMVHSAQEQRYGCTLVIDLDAEPGQLSGQYLDAPLDLTRPRAFSLARALCKVDGALHIGADLRLHGFACLLDGLSAPGENRARGARFNSALRFTAARENCIVVVVSSDRPVSIIRSGVELTAQCEILPVRGRPTEPPRLDEWLMEV